MKLKRLLFLIIGIISLGAGVVGVVLPILPSVPFFLLTVFCFSQSSDKLHKWMVNSKLYKKNLEPFLESKGMTVKTKLGIIIPITIVMAIGFIAMRNVPIGRIILAIVWVAHIIAFTFFVKTMSKEDAQREEQIKRDYPNKSIIKVDGIKSDDEEVRIISTLTNDVTNVSVNKRKRTLIVRSKEDIDRASIESRVRELGVGVVSV